MKHSVLSFASAAAILVLYYPNAAGAGAYLNSAHGNSTYGVSRVSTSTSPIVYARGNCAHCHEQHASINGNEPAPDGNAPSANLLFSDNYVSQTDGFCLKCHTDSGSVQSGGGIVNRSYSYRAGRWTADLLNDVREAFAYISTPPASYPSHSSHDLASIRAFISNPVRAAAWNYNILSNPCAACHNPHVAQGDPANAANGTKTGSGGWMLTRPSQHATMSPVNLWGDVATEKLSFYTGLYQAPNRFGGVGYEPDGSATTDGSNLTDFNTFCMDCHSTTNTVNSITLGRDLIKIDWSGGPPGDLHGQATRATAQLTTPYTNNSSYVLACTDCHEPHGSPNIFLIRAEVNNGTVAVDGAAQAVSSSQWASLCERCHGNPVAIGASHHAIAGAEPCATCHPSGAFATCTNCHYHGSSATVNGITYRTF
ncbi:MAG: hypothetical protein HGA96_01035 [Desulfobulbaceae bacterium]|nr:hypothetical protein [Desulfobulbaceae bacterium]